MGGWVSVVGIATRHGLDSLGLKPQWGQEIFSSAHPFTLNLGPTQSPVKWTLGNFAGGEVSGAWNKPLTPI
jgi:hypothetical protein